MSLIVEDGTGMADADSYVGVEEANLYNANMGNTAWATITDEQQKETMLRRAALWLDGKYGPRLLSGHKKKPEQGLLFPIVGGFYVDGYPIDANSVPREYKFAQIEAALVLAQGGHLATNITGGPLLKRKKIDVLEKEWFEGSYGLQPDFGIINILLTSLFGESPTEDDFLIGSIWRS